MFRTVPNALIEEAP